MSIERRYARAAEPPQWAIAEQFDARFAGKRFRIA
jgi:hypothetical protein